uniref:Uncharacterized protein LOC113784320 n=1 Tax=Cicer arietinum TaxID=3827 RepID=A0A3Q7XZS9_CICAR|nr:uncharacterized protein LOC113784320 [Cicer arietinum]XP_027190181.1 uncharacterized protein LOC113786563 [Cicer arietinum]
MDPNTKLWGEGGVLVDTKRYQRLVGKLIYLSYTRPDITFSVIIVSQFMHSPYEEYLEAVYFLRRLVKEMSIFMDADWESSVRTEYRPLDIVPNLVTWRSKKQGDEAKSSAEAKFRAMAQGICEGLLQSP